MKTNTKYIIKNWSEYNKSLKDRGRITFWISDDAIKNWSGERLSGRRGASNYYSDTSIITCLTIMSIYHLNLRSLEGFMESLFELMNLDLEVPDYSTISRRRKSLEYQLPKQKLPEKWYLEEVHIVVDSTGLKIYGEGEWKVRMHKASKRRTWRKMHLGINESNGLIMGVKVTKANITDDGMLKPLIQEIDNNIVQVSADKAYDKKKCYKSLMERGIKATISPREDARLWLNEKDWINHQRNKNLIQILLKGKDFWKLSSGYSRRSISENTMFRYKAIFGDKINSRIFESQVTDITIRCMMLNKMFENGKPISVCMF